MYNFRDLTSKFIPRGITRINSRVYLASVKAALLRQNCAVQLCSTQARQCLIKGADDNLVPVAFLITRIRSLRFSLPTVQEFACFEETDGDKPEKRRNLCGDSSVNPLDKVRPVSSKERHG